MICSVDSAAAGVGSAEVKLVLVSVFASAELKNETYSQENEKWLIVHVLWDKCWAEYLSCCASGVLYFL